MTKMPIVLFALLASLTAGPLFAASAAHAGRQGGSAAQGAPALSAGTHQHLGEIHRLMGEGRHEQARERLLRLLPRVERRPYEKALVLRTLGYLHVAVSDFPEAVRYFEKTLTLQALAEEPHRSTQYDLAQLYMSLEAFEQAIVTLEAWFAQAEAPSAEAHLLLGNGYARLRQYRKALNPVRRAIALSETPREPWYQLLLALHYELQDYRASTDVLEEMIRLFPTQKTYWEQLTSLYFTLKEDWRALAVMEMANQKGLLTESKELLKLAQLYSHLEIPYRAARLLQDALQSDQVESNPENRKLLADLWLQAREADKAAATLQSAAREGGDGRFDLRLGRVYYGQGRWQEAADALQAALDKGGLAQEGEAWLLLAMSHYELNRHGQAQEFFQRAANDPRTRKAASQWLAYLASAR